MNFEEATEDIVESLRKTKDVSVSTFKKDMRYEMEQRFMAFGQRNVIVKDVYKLLREKKLKEINQIPPKIYRQVIRQLFQNERIEL